MLLKCCHTCRRTSMLPLVTASHRIDFPLATQAASAPLPPLPTHLTFVHRIQLILPSALLNLSPPPGKHDTQTNERKEQDGCNGDRQDDAHAATAHRSIILSLWKHAPSSIARGTRARSVTVETVNKGLALLSLYQAATVAVAPRAEPRSIARSAAVRIGRSFDAPGSVTFRTHPRPRTVATPDE